MSKTTRIASAWASIALAGALTSPPALAGEWVRLETPHFTMDTRRDDSTVRGELQQLERFRWLTLQLMGASEKGARAQVPFKIVMLQGHGALHRLLPALDDDSAAAYGQCADDSGALVTYSMDYWSQNLRVLQAVVAHHMVFQYAQPGSPLWFRQGFSEYMSTVTADGDTLTLGAIPHDRLQALQLLPTQGDNWLPLARVLRWGTAEDKRLDDSDVLADTSVSWLLVHYLYSDPGRQAKLANYLGRVAGGEDPVAAFEHAMGVPLPEMVRRLQAYSTQDMQMLRIDGKGMPAYPVSAVPLGPDADDYLPDAAPLQTCVSGTSGKTVLARLRATAAARAHPGPGLRLALADAEVRFGDAAAAIAGLEPLVASDPDNPQAQYLLGRAWGRRSDALTGDEQAAARDKERQYLIKAYRLRKNDPPTLYYLARALARDGIDNNVLNAARAARTLLPSVTDYALYEAQVDLVAGDRDLAVKALQPIEVNVARPKFSARIRAAIADIRAGKDVKGINAQLAAADPD